MLKQKLKNLTDKERRTFKLHTIHMVLEGVIDGSLLLNEFILIKSLMGTNYQISYMFQFSVVVLLFSVLFNEWVKRAKSKKKLLQRVAMVTRIPLAGLMFFPSSHEAIAGNPIYASIFLLVFLFYYIYKPVVLPTINLLLRANYQDKNFGKLYSYSTGIKKIVVIAFTFGFGLLLDFDNYAFTWFYPILAILGIGSIHLLTLIDYEPPKNEIIRGDLWSAIKSSIQEMLHIIKTNKPYRDFEIGFMFYGFAWMATYAVITIFMEKTLHLNYSSVAFYKNTFNLVAILFLPFFGKLIGKIDPRKFGMYTFAFLLLHILFVLLTKHYPMHIQILGIEVYLMLTLSYIFNGLFTAAMALLWGIGSSYFCKKEDAGSYQSIHLSAVGFRSLFAPVFGIFLYEIIGYDGTFIIGIISLILAVTIMFSSMKKYKLIKLN